MLGNICWPINKNLEAVDYTDGFRVGTIEREIFAIFATHDQNTKIKPRKFEHVNFCMARRLFQNYCNSV